MVTNARHKDDEVKVADNIGFNKQTLRKYQEIAEKAAKKQTLSESQRKQIIDNWCAKRHCKLKKDEVGRETLNTYEKHVDQLQEAAKEFANMNKDLQECDIDNLIHAAKIMRIGEEHARKAQSYRAKVANESTKLRRELNSDKTQGGKHLSKAIGSKATQPLVVVERDQHTKDGGKPGELTSNPQDIDAVVKRTWQAIHGGIGGAIGEAIEAYLHKYSRYIIKSKVFEVPAITGERVYEAFSKTKDSAGALDGWQPKEMSLLALEVCEEIAIMLNQIEQGAEWPKSAVHARVVFLEKEGAPVGKITSYRPLTITAPIYRCWATMRLEDMHDWVGHWALDEMHAGVPGKGAVDAWHAALTNIEELKLDGKAYCGAVSDIMKFFDQIRRHVVYRIAEAAGMPTNVLRAYMAYIENMKIYTCLGEAWVPRTGEGAAYHRVAPSP